MKTRTLTLVKLGFLFFLLFTSSAQAQNWTEILDFKHWPGALHPYPSMYRHPDCIYRLVQRDKDQSIRLVLNGRPHVARPADAALHFDADFSLFLDPLRALGALYYLTGTKNVPLSDLLRSKETAPISVNLKYFNYNLPSYLRTERYPKLLVEAWFVGTNSGSKNVYTVDPLPLFYSLTLEESCPVPPVTVEPTEKSF